MRARNPLTRSSITRQVALGVVLAAVFSTGATQCSEFRTVEVPTTDSAPPLVATKIFYDNREELYLPGMDDIRPASAQTQVTLVPGGVDSGGVRRVAMDGTVELQCHRRGITEEFTIDLGDQSDTQAGTTGSMVSNGMYLVKSFRPIDYQSACTRGWELQSMRLIWHWTVDDFLSNRAEGYGAVVWEKP